MVHMVIIQLCPIKEVATKHRVLQNYVYQLVLKAKKNPSFLSELHHQNEAWELQRE